MNTLELRYVEKYVKILESISKRHNDIAQSKGEFSKAYSLIKEIRNQIITGENPSKKINELKILVDSIKNDMRKSAAEKQSSSIKRFFERLLDKIDQSLIQAKDATTDQAQIDKADELILEIKELLLILCATIISFSAYAIIIWSMKYEPIGIVASMRESSIIFASILGLALLKEKIGYIRIISGILFFIGVGYIFNA